MRLIFGLVMIVGIGIAGFAVYMAQGYIGEYQAELARANADRAQMVKTVGVFVLNQPKRYGERLGRTDVRMVRWPEDAIPAGAFLTEEELFPENAEGLRAITRAMEKDEAILKVKVTAPGEDAGVASRLSPGMRAFAIRTDVSSGVSGFLRPGDRVDVYWTGRSVEGQDITRLIDANIKLIAVDQIADEDRNSPLVARTVTVEAKPEQVAALAQAQATGRLTLSLVGAEDETVASTVQVDQRQLLDYQERTVVQAEKEKVCTVKTRRGAEVVEIPIACND